MKKKEENMEVMALFIDLEDAFNKINLDKLHRILVKIKVPVQIINWIKTCFSNRNLSIKTNRGIISDSTNNGIPQGDVLSPIIFVLYTMGLFQCDSEFSKLFQFADDMTILAWG